MPSQCLDHLERLAVVEQVHDVRVAERVRCHRHREVHAVVRRALHCRLQPVAHRLVGDRPERLAPLRTFACHPHLHLTHKRRIGERHQAHRIFWRPAAPASDLFRENAHERARPVDDERLGRQRAALADARAGVPERVKEKVVSPVWHVVQQRGDLGRQHVERRHAVRGGHAPQRHRGGKVRTRGERQRRHAPC